MIRLCTLGLLPILFISISLQAQPGNSGIQTTPLAGTVILKEVPDKYTAEVNSLEAPEPDGEQEQAHFRKLKEKVSQLYPHRITSSPTIHAKATTIPIPIIVQAFVPDSNSATPPDNSFGVSAANAGFNMMNSRVSVLNTLNGSISLVKSLSTLTTSVGLNDPNNDGRYDPKVVYDPEADRFICVILSGLNENSHIIFGFSQSNDPGGAWNFYKMTGDYAGDTLWFDYPIISITHNELFLTGNKLVYNGSFQTGFRKSLIYEVRKSDGYAGNSLSYKIWDSVRYGGNPIRNIFPVNGGSSIQGPSQYFLSVRNMDIQNDSVFLMKIGDTLGSTGNTLSVAAYVSNLNYGFPPDGRQLGFTKLLQTNDARVLGAYAEGTEIQFVNTSVNTASGSDAIYHGRIANYTSSPVVSANFITVDTMDFAYPNISFAGQVGGKNSSIISFDYSGPNLNPGLGAVLWDGASYSPLLRVKDGESYINNASATGVRWGDYSGTQPVFGKPGNVWIAGIYGKANNRYGIWSALLRSPYFTSVPSVGTSNNAALLYPNPSLQFIRLEFSMNKEQSVQFSLYNMNGQLVDHLVDAKCAEGMNEIQFNTASLPAGQYVLQGNSADGHNLVHKTFIKQ